MSDSPICSSIEITFDLDAVGLVGGEYESEPSVHTWCSFNPHRIIKSHSLDTKREPIYFKSHGPMYTMRDKETLLNSEAYHSFFGNHALAAKKEGDEEEAVEKLDFVVPQNTGVYKTRKPIVYDMSSKTFHGHKTMRTDGAIWMKLMTVSLFSGVPKIDENDRIFTKVKRGIQSGVCQLQLCDLYKEAAAQRRQGQPDVSFEFETNFVDPKLMNIEMGEIAERYIKKHKITIEEVPRDVEQNIIETAFIRSRKAIITTRVTIRNFDFNAYKDSRFSLSDLKTSPLNTYMKMRNSQMSLGSPADMTPMTGRVAFDPILFNSMPGMAEIRLDMEHVLRIYCHALVPIDDNGSLYQPANKNVKKLHMPQFVGEQGKTAVVGFFSSHTPHTREYANEEARRIELELYDSNDGTEELLSLMVRASLRRHGMTKALFMSVIAEYFNEKNKSEVASGLFITALKVIADVGTFAANSVYYTADFRYQKLDDNAIKLIGEIRTRMAHYKKINLDSFDSVPLNGTSGAGDCEDSANVAASILQCLGYGRYSLKGKWVSDLLNSCRAVLDRVVIFAVGATVTSAYVDNNNKPIDMKEENRDLPLVGDTLDENSQCDGHCFAVLLFDAVVDQLLANGNLLASQLRTVRDQWPVASFKKRDYTVPIIVLEGTGSVEPTLLPIDEVYEHKDRKVEGIQARAEISFLKEMKAKLNSDKNNKEVMEMFSGEGVGFYIAKQDPNRRISRFYREMIHGVPCNLYRKSDILSQIVFCKKVHTGRGGPNSVTYKYGVNTGEFLRSGVTATKEIALIAPFKDNVKEWRERVVPMMECIENQMPIMKFGHYTKKEYNEGIHSRFIGNPLLQEDDQEQEARIMAIIESVAGNPDLTMIRLQTREWKLNDPIKVAKLNRFFMSLDRVVCHAMFSEKHVICCDALVDILIVAKVLNK